MTAISNLYAQLITELTAIFPTSSGWHRLSNPYKVHENAEVFLQKGWGLVAGPGVNDEAEIGCVITVTRDFTLRLTRKVEALEVDGPTKAETELLLFEDLFLVVNHFEQSPTLNNLVTWLKYANDTGIEYVSGEKDNFLVLSATLPAKYFESYV